MQRYHTISILLSDTDYIFSIDYLMKKIFFLLSLAIVGFALLSCDGDDEAITIPSVEFTLPEGSYWTPVMEQYKIHKIDNEDKLAQFIKCGEDEISAFDVDFEKETLLLVYFINNPVKNISQQLIQYKEEDPIYTFQIDIEHHKGNVEDIGINHFVVLKTSKIDSGTSTLLIVNEK